MSAFHHRFDFVQILIFIAVALRTLLIAPWHHAATCSISSSVHSASRWGLSLASSAHSVSAASVSSSVIAAKFHPTSLLWSASSCLSAATSYSITSWWDPVAWLSAWMNHVVLGRFADVKSISDSPSWSSHVVQCVGWPSFPTSSPFSSITSSQQAAFCCTRHLESHWLLCGLKSPVGTVPPCLMTPCQANVRASLSPDCVSLWS